MGRPEAPFGVLTLSSPTPRSPAGGEAEEAECPDGKLVVGLRQGAREDQFFLFGHSIEGPTFGLGPRVPPNPGMGDDGDPFLPRKPSATVALRQASARLDRPIRDPVVASIPCRERR
jgi:hypothetical protein